MFLCVYIDKRHTKVRQLQILSVFLHKDVPALGDYPDFCPKPPPVAGAAVQYKTIQKQHRTIQKQSKTIQNQSNQKPYKASQDDAETIQNDTKQYKTIQYNANQ